MKQWNEAWARRQARETQAASIQEKKTRAGRRTEEAQAELTVLENVLAHTLSVNDAVDWEALKNHSGYPQPKPTPPIFDPEPQETDAKYKIQPGLLDYFLASKRVHKEQAAKRRYEADLHLWARKKTEELTQYKTRWLEWKSRRDEFIARRDAANAAIDEQKADYLRGDDPQSIIDYCDLVLSSSHYPDYFPQSFELDYNSSNRLLIVDYQLPALDVIPTLREVRNVQTRDEFTEKHITQAQLNRLYGGLLYQIALRTIHELYEADRIGALHSVVFNGYVTSVDPATGHETTACILSVQANRDTFLEINLTRVDPKVCFKSLKGVSSAKLHSLTPVAPLVRMEREDSRFVPGYGVVDAIQEDDNLAAMDWEDFEHLIRELFERIYSEYGGEVKVTRASRDGGVDAVVFDPDPIRGGKVVIQAKRYTSTVGVAAVRDLYGTLMNEGATKGILVTTSDYGPDAYDFAKGKPLTLLSGSNLLHLLEKYGHKARIDLKEARELAGR